jgi:hypothetical protein
MEYTLGLALLDFVPIFAFLTGAYFLVKITLLARGKPCGRMMMAGTLLVFTGGFLKATWKLLYTLDVADITVMSEGQFVWLSFGFLAMLVAMIYLTRSSKKPPASGPVMAIAVWKIPFLAVMTLCSLGAQGILTYVSFQKKARLAAALFIVAVLCMLGMSGMASGSEQTITMQWIEESINAFGQIAFAVGSYLLYKVYQRESQTALAGN